MTKYDVGHISFLLGIKTSCDIFGTDLAKGNLVRIAEELASAVTDDLDFASIEEFARSCTSGENPIAHFEGEIVYEDGVFRVPMCPFAKAIESFSDVIGAMPECYGDITDTFNKEVGGTAVSPFCLVHQTFRRLAGEKVKINGKEVQVLQLGCKSGSGKTAISDENAEKVEVSRKDIEDILSSVACAYSIKED